MEMCVLEDPSNDYVSLSSSDHFSCLIWFFIYLSALKRNPWLEKLTFIWKKLWAERCSHGKTLQTNWVKKDKQTAYLTLSHVRASRYWTECRSICVLIFFYNTLILCQREAQDWNSFADSQTDRDLWDLCRIPELHARTSHDFAAFSEPSDRATDSDPSVQIFK